MSGASGGVVRPHVVLDEGVPEAAGPRTLVAFKAQFRGKLGARHGSVLLVRPDGYVAFHTLGFDPGTLASGLEGWGLRDSSSGAALPRLAAHS